MVFAHFAKFCRSCPYRQLSGVACDLFYNLRTKSDELVIEMKERNRWMFQTVSAICSNKGVFFLLLDTVSKK